MSSIGYYLFLFLLIVLIYAIPVFLGFMVYTLSRMKLLVFPSIVLGSIIPLVFTYILYINFFPTDSFYEDEFEEVTKMDFPKSGEILKKDASFPIYHPDYCSCALIQFDENDFEKILESIKNNEIFVDTFFIYSEQYAYVMKNIDEEKIIYKAFNSYEYKNSVDYNFIAFLNDNRTIVIHRIDE
jgi:hypothetical protein